MVSAWWQLFHTLATRFANNYDLTGEGPEDWKQLEYPAWWLDITDYVTFPQIPPPLPLRSRACTMPPSGPEADSINCDLVPTVVIGCVSGLLVFVAAEVVRCSASRSGGGSGYRAI